MIWPFKKKIEKRANYTQMMMELHQAQLIGATGVAELTGVVQTCISLWENGLGMADVQGTDALSPHVLALTARSLALTGEALWYIDDQLLAVQDYDLQTVDGVPKAYRLTLSDIGGGRSVTALAGEVIHLRIGSTMREPWRGTAPLQRASLSAGLLETIERTLAETYENAPIGSQVMPRPEDPSGQDDGLAQSFRGRRGRVLLPESVNVTAAGGATPGSDWKPNDLTPDLSDSELLKSLYAARAGVMGVFGVLPALLSDSAQGPLVREAQRHLCQWTLEPIAKQLEVEASTKLGADVELDVSSPLRAFDAGGQARALKAVIDALAAAKEAGVNPADAAALAGIDI